MASLSTPMLVSSPPKPSIQQKPIHLHQLPFNDDRRFVNHTLVKTLESCTNVHQIKQIHAQFLRLGLFSDPYAASKLLTPLALPPLSDLIYARKVFDEIPHPNLYTWNTLIRGYASSDDPSRAISVFIELLHEDLPNKFTFPFVIKAAGAASDGKFGRSVHGMLVKMNLGLDLYAMNSLVHMYASCGCLDVAYRVFSGICCKDVVSWNSMIASFSLGGYPEKALGLFYDMLGQNVEPNELTMVVALSACGEKGDLEAGRFLVSYIEDRKIDLGLSLSNAVLDMYAKCGRMEEAKAVFDGMGVRDAFSWSIMVAGYAKVGDYGEARRVLYGIPCQDIAVWNALISAYAQNGKAKEALEVFHDLRGRNDVKPNEVTLVGVLSACAQIGAVGLGKWVHLYIKKNGVKPNCHLVTALIDMYSKCGDIEKAVEVFGSAEKRDVFVWSSMIAGYGSHGQGHAALDLFYEMQKAKVKPNEVTFTNILAACSHNGLVEQGRKIFNEMDFFYKVTPGINHYACMVDMLGRAGLLDEAMEVIQKMPMTPNSSVWQALLGASSIHLNLDIAETAFRELVELEPSHHRAYDIMSNVYAKSENWGMVSMLRKRMKELRLKKD